MAPSPRALAILLLPATVSAVLVPCRGDASSGVSTGIPDNGCGLFSNTECDLQLRYECDTMYPSESYSPVGIPCGFAGAAACVPEPNISEANVFYPVEALEAVYTYIDELLPRGQNNFENNTLLYPGVEATELYIMEPTELNITFVGDGGCQRNSLGMTVLPAGVDPRDITLMDRKRLLEDELEFSIIFPNVDFRFCQCGDPETPDAYEEVCTETPPPLQRGATMQLLPDFRGDPDNTVFPAGVTVVFFVIPDGFDTGFAPGEVYTRPAETLLFSTPELNDPDLRLRAPSDLRQHAVVFRGGLIPNGAEYFDFTRAVFFAFEDRRRFGPDDGLPPSNNDFQDVVFFVESMERLAFGEPSAAPTFLGQPVTGQFVSDAPSVSDVCAEGIVSSCGNVCCADSCGRCGGCDCASLDGGADLCCPSAILFNGIFCKQRSDVGCILDDTLICGIDGSGCPM